jgi:phage-related holin
MIWNFDLILIMKKTLIYCATALSAFFAPIEGALWFVVALVVADTITGIMKAGKDDVSNIQSKKAFPMIPKLMFYCILVILAHAVSITVDKQIPWVKLALIGISWIEVKSIDENFKVLFGFSFLDKCLEAGKKISEIKRK